MSEFPETSAIPTKETAWCREQQLAALEHMKPDHKCLDVQCTPATVEQWLLDSFCEEMILEHSGKPVKAGICVFDFTGFSDTLKNETGTPMAVNHRSPLSKIR
jgi:hypothetical protein